VTALPFLYISPSFHITLPRKLDRRTEKIMGRLEADMNKILKNASSVTVGTEKDNI
jgi:hypothetical protein